MTGLIEEDIPVQDVIGFPIAALPFDAQLSVILEWAKARLSKIICIANVHMLIEAHRNAQFAAVLRSGRFRLRLTECRSFGCCGCSAYLIKIESQVQMC